MPFYEYECKNCGHTLEAMQKISESPLKKCPDCGKSQLQRLMSAPVFRLKGGGWYETDFKGDKDNQRNLADRPEADAPKDLPKDATVEAAKDAAAPGAEGKGKDGSGKDGNGKGGNGKDAKSADGAGGKDTTSKDKPADKPATTPSTEPTKKPMAGKTSVRGRTAVRHKSPARRPIKKPAAKAKRRR
jgi:putative FmdB family regulatory protein